MPTNTPFHNYPNKYPKARSKAKEMMNAIHELTKKGPRTLVATVVDTQFHVTQGYCTCTTELGVIRVYAIPYGSCVPQMRVYVRFMGAHSTNRDYIFDGFAQNAGRLGTSGSLLYNVPVTTPATALAKSGVGQIPGASGRVGPTGFYWHCFFFLPALPQGTSAATLFQFVCASTPLSPTLQLELLPTGLLQFRSSDGHGYRTRAPIAPHSIHWVVIQPGLTAQELLVDGNAAAYTGITSGSDVPTFVGNNESYTVSLLGNADGTALPPLGTWISKFGYGQCYNTGVVALPNPTVVPRYDTDLFNGVGTTTPGLLTKVLLLCTEGPGALTLTNSGIGLSSGTFGITSANSTIQTLGPY